MLFPLWKYPRKTSSSTSVHTGRTRPAASSACRKCCPSAKALHSPSQAVDLPPGAGRSDHPDGGRPMLRMGADSRQSCGLYCSLPGAEASAVSRLRPGRDLGLGLTLVRLDLRDLSRGAGGTDPGAVPGGCRPHGVPLSVYSGSYIAMLLKAMPLFAAVGAVLGSWFLDRPFCFRRVWENGPWMPRGTETAVAAGLLTVSIILCVVTCCGQRKRELI